MPAQFAVATTALITEGSNSLQYWIGGNADRQTTHTLEQAALIWCCSVLDTINA
jgi:hypothetical protein